MSKPSAVVMAEIELRQAEKVQEAADLVKNAADARVLAARQALWALGVIPEEYRNQAADLLG